MSAEKNLSALPGVDADKAAASAALAAQIISEIPDMPTVLTPREKKIWLHVTSALLEYGLIHRTDGLMLTIICRTFVDWIEATEGLEKYKKAHKGEYLTTAASGYQQPHPLYYVARDHKKSLLAWLPEAALTVPSFQKIKGDKLADGQGELFDDPIEKFKSQKTAIGMRVVSK